MSPRINHAGKKKFPLRLVMHHMIHESPATTGTRISCARPWTEQQGSDSENAIEPIPAPLDPVNDELPSPGVMVPSSRSSRNTAHRFP